MQADNEQVRFDFTYLQRKENEHLMKMKAAIFVCLGALAVHATAYAPTGQRTLMETKADADGWRDGRATWYDHPWYVVALNNILLFYPC